MVDQPGNPDEVVVPVEETTLANTPFAQDLTNAHELIQTIKLLTSELDGHKEKIREGLNTASLSQVKVGPLRALLTKPFETRKLDIDKLLALGVSKSIIEASYTVTIGKSQLRIFSEVK